MPQRTESDVETTVQNRSLFWESEAVRSALLEEPEASDRVTTDPDIMDGMPVVKGTRIPVYVILEHLEAGHDAAEILRSYPVLCEEDVVAAIRFAGLTTSIQ